MERIHNFQLITRYDIKYNGCLGQVPQQFSLFIFKLLPYHLIRPNIDFMMNEISNLSRIEIKDTFI